MKEMKRILALILCMVMLVGYVPVNAFAAEGEGTTEPSVEESVPETTEAVLLTESTESTEVTVPATTEETVPATTEETVPETTVEQVSEATVPEAAPVLATGMMMSKASAPETVEEETVEEETVEIEALYAASVAESDYVPVELASDLTAPTKAQVKTALDEALAYIDNLTVNNSSNDPATVVGNFGTHFTWDNEKRENSKDYLYDWSYYNGVVFEGLEYLYEVTGESKYKDYVVEYMSSLITSDGTWATCGNNSAKTAAGYVSYHGADCYKTASLLLDAYDMTGDSRYPTMAETLYADLDAAAEKYLLSNAGNNYHHTWASASSPNLWLDGLYMIMPFQAEYAAHINDTAELQAIVDRLTWVSNNMYNADKGMFYHAANSADSVSGTYWLRSMGWYAAAIADVMDSVSSSQRATLAAQLTKLADGLKQIRNTSGMWQNNMGAAASDTNPYETSGTALICYAVMKAVNNGWIDDSYAEMALTALVGICNDKLSGNNLTDICFKGVPGGSNSTFYDNEGKGVGPFIMLTAEVQEYYDKVLSLPAMTGISVSSGDTYAVGETLAPVVTASYDDGTTGTVADYSIENAPDMNVAGVYTVTVKVGEFSAEYTFTVVEYELTGLTVTKQPTTTKYFVSTTADQDSLALNIEGLEVTATFSDGSTKVIEWNSFDSTADGYSLSFDMSLLGSQDVGIRYTYKNVTLTTSFTITTYEKVIANEASDISIELSVPGVTDITVTENTQDENVIAAVDGLVENFRSYDINLTGYNQGEKVTVTLPKPDGVEKPAVYYIPEDGTAPQPIASASLSADGTKVEFVTDHFTTYAVGQRSLQKTEETSTTLSGGKIYTLDTNGVTTNKNYLIVNTNSDSGYALTNNDGTAGRTAVTISNGQITVTDDAAIAWVFSGSTSGNVKNSNRYVYMGSSSLLSTSSRTLVISNENGAYQIYRERDKGNYYLKYTDNNWTYATGATSVYLYEYTGDVPGGTVTFAVQYDDSTMKPGDTMTALPLVTVADEDAESYTVTWVSSNTAVATVDDNGVVTAKAEGEADITATLTRANGSSVSLERQFSVQVKNKSITGVEWAPAYGSVYVDSSDSTNTGAKIKVTYDDNSYDYVTVTVGMLDASTANVGEIEIEGIVYEGVTLPEFTLYVVERPDMNYPEYPDPGSVKVDKFIADYSQFQNTGVAEINLVTSGLPVEVGVDVILVADLSNSMAWEVGGRDDAATHEDTKLAILQESISNFADVILEDGETKNTISMVTFGGYDADYCDNSDNTMEGSYADVTRTLFGATNDPTAVKTAVNNIRLLADSGYSGGYRLSFDGGLTYDGNYGNTNYDYAFMETADAIAALKQQYAENNGGASYDTSGRSLYILFMTDGAPSNYNGEYYNNQTSNTRPDVLATWINQDGDEVRYNQANKKTVATWYPVISQNSLYWAGEVANTQSVTEIISIGFDIDNGGFSSMVFTEEAGYPLLPVLENLVEGKTLRAYKADDASALQEVYAKLAGELKEAATEAYFADQMGEVFDIQMASSVTKFIEDNNETEIIELSPKPQITISTYNIYIPENVGQTIGGVTVTADMIGERYGNKTVHEIVTFNDEGDEAYSDQSYTRYVTNADGSTTKTEFEAGNNILVNGVIYGENFWYNTTSATILIDKDNDGTAEYPLEGETFCWNIGTIHNEEFVLSYYVYLNGAAEGKRPEGTYETNEYAKLYYKNWLGNDAEQEVQTPALAWDAASVYYGFYLVNKEGKPVMNRATGATGTFDQAIKVTSKIFHDTVYLNEIDQFATIEVYSTKVPEGYVIYDMGAAYKIKINSDLELSGWTITNTRTQDTTYVTDYHGTDYTNVLDSETIDTTGYDFTSTTVWFAVVWEPSTVPDTVVVDYGLPVDIGVLENDMFGTAGTLIGVGETADKPVTSAAQFTDKDSDKFVAEKQSFNYGTAEVYGKEVRYTPTTMEWNKNDADAVSYDRFSYEVRYSNSNNNNAMEYYYGDVTVIPATIVYYEDTFTAAPGEDGVGNNYITFRTFDANKQDVTETNNAWSTVGNTITNATQNEDRPGEYSLPNVDANNLYGYDPAYASMSGYSLGSAHKITVDGTKYGTASFSFYGTGFDIISLTSNTTGTILVDVKNSAGEAVKQFFVDTYYGYKWDYVTDENGTTKPGWVQVDTNDPNALYQVPVMKIEGLDYGRYDVVITAVYDDFFAHNGKSYDFYLDAIRIYDPAGEGDDVVSSKSETKTNADGTTTTTTVNTTIADIYGMDGERVPQFFELRNLLLSANTFASMDEDTITEGIIFIDGNKALGSADTGTVTGSVVTDYTNFGPNNELYLAKDQAVTFRMSLDVLSSVVPPEGYHYEIDTIQLALKSVGGTADAKIWAAEHDTAAKVDARNINTATDMYYDITDLNDETVVIMNSSSDAKAILSVTNFKVTYKLVEGANPVAPAFTPFMVSRSIANTAVMSMNLVEEPEVVEPETTVPDISEPEVSEPETTEPETSEPETTEPETSEPETTEPEVTVPKEDDREAAVEAVKNAVKKAVEETVKKVVSIFSNIFGRWF